MDKAVFEVEIDLSQEEDNLINSILDRIHEALRNEGLDAKVRLELYSGTFEDLDKKRLCS